MPNSQGEGNSNPLQCSCLENPRDRGAWRAAIYGVAESDTTDATLQQQQLNKLHSSTLAWEIPWMEEPRRLQSMGSLSQTRLSGFTFTFHFSLSCIGEGNGNPLQCSCLESPRDGGAQWAAVCGVAQSWTRLKRLSGSSSRCVVISHCGFNFTSLPDHLEKAMAPHSSTLAWKIPWTEEPGRLQSMGSLRVGHD